MKRSLFQKLLFGHMAIIFFLSALILIFSFRIDRQHTVQSLKQQLERIALVMRPSILDLVNAGKTDDMDALVKKTGAESSVRITVIALDGTVLADSDRDPKTMENHAIRVEVKAALRGETGIAVRRSPTIDRDMLYVAVPLKNGGGIKGVLRASLFVSDISSFIHQLHSQILAAVMVIIVLAVAASLFLSRKLTLPLKELTAAARKVAEGNFDIKVFLSNRDEFQQLAESFNAMTSQIKQLFNEQQRQKEEIASIISSIQEGICVIGPKGVILISNAAFHSMVSDERPEGKYYWESVRNPFFIDLVKSVAQHHKNASVEIELAPRTFFCRVTYLEARDSTIALFFDMTEIRKLEKIKKDFVLNVSHELRTPLTAIKGFAETLEDEISESGKKHLDVIMRHTDRLINIVQDLITLSRIEEKDVLLEMANVDLEALIQNVLTLFEQHVKEKGLFIRLEAEKGLPLFQADAYRLEQVFINLIDNAIKYTEKGGVTIRLKKSGASLLTEVQDTGIGIPKEDMSRIFERFYVVDKSRSRKLGGTGLGLSIVKHIVLLHSGNISAESVPGEGSCFTVSIPFKQSI